MFDDLHDMLTELTRTGRLLAIAQYSLDRPTYESLLNSNAMSAKDANLAIALFHNVMQADDGVDSDEPRNSEVEMASVRAMR